MYLVDTNVWLERLLDQVRAEEVGRFFAHIPSETLFLTDFSFHSICVVLTKLNRNEVLLQFVRDAFIEGSVSIVHLKPEDIESVLNIIEHFNLDFDDAYQYVVAENYGLEIISFDSDFDRTEKGRKTPGEVLK
ncbi:MAG: PIN domain-containing protein [candidate division WOR-3 bacterium]